MAKHDKDQFSEVNQSTNKRLPSRLEIHGHKYKKGNNQQPDITEEEPKRALRTSIPFILLVVLLLLPIGIHTWITKEKPAPNVPSNSVGEEISIEDYTNETIPSTVDTNEQKNNANQLEHKTLNEEQEKAEAVQKDIQQRDPEKSEVPEKLNEADDTEGSPTNEQYHENENEMIHHTVQQGETLYRISMNYYKSADGIDKIKAENGLVDNEIIVGQTLKIPKP